MRIALGLLALLVLLYVAAMFIPIDPQDRTPGTRLSGDLAADQNPDWSFLKPSQEIYVQTNTPWLIPHSVTTISSARGGQLFVPCGRGCSTKRWPKNVERDPRVTLKINGELYNRTAVRITDESALRTMLGLPPGQALPDLRLYRMDPR